MLVLYHRYILYAILPRLCYNIVMMLFSKRVVVDVILKRIFIFMLGVLNLIVVRYLFLPFFENHTPMLFTLFLTYISVAYFLIPLCFRFYRYFYMPNHIPRYSVTPDGFASDPINIGFICTKQELTDTMLKAGWFIADKKTIRTVLKTFSSFIRNNPYPTAPFSTLLLFGRKQDIGFQKPVKNDKSGRHHVRFWECSTDNTASFHEHVAFWRRFHTPKKGDNNQKRLFLGAASKDRGLRIIKHNLQITHMIEPDTNKERDLIVNDISLVKKIKHIKRESTGRPLHLPNRVLGGSLFTDGYIKILEF